MNTLTLLYGGLAVAAALIGHLAAQRSRAMADTRTVGFMVLFVWLSGRVAVWLLGVPLATLVYPPVDVLAATVVMGLCERRPATWKALIVGTFLLQLVCHVVFWMQHAAWREMYYRYTVTLNVLFLVQLAAVAGPGIWDAVGRHHFGGLFSRLSARHSAVTRAKWPTT